MCALLALASAASLAVLVCFELVLMALVARAACAEIAYGPLMRWIMHANESFDDFA